MFYSSFFSFALNDQRSPTHSLLNQTHLSPFAFSHRKHSFLGGLRIERELEEDPIPLPNEVKRTIGLPWAGHGKAPLLWSLHRRLLHHFFFIGNALSGLELGLNQTLSVQCGGLYSVAYSECSGVVLSMTVSHHLHAFHSKIQTNSQFSLNFVWD